MTTMSYRQASLHLLEQARTELEAGDLRQASEKGWGAAAQAIKAVCERRSWPHRGHRDLHQTVDRLTEETNNPEFADQFGAASMLHQNFYENWHGETVVRDRLQRVRRFVNLVNDLP